MADLTDPMQPVERREPTTMQLCSASAMPRRSSRRSRTTITASPWRTSRPSQRCVRRPRCSSSSAAQTSGRASSSTTPRSRPAGTRTATSSSTTSLCRGGTPSSSVRTGLPGPRRRLAQWHLCQPVTGRRGRAARRRRGSDRQVPAHLQPGPVTVAQPRRRRSSQPDRLTIGAVIAALRRNFPDVSVSKLRFLEAAGWSIRPGPPPGTGSMRSSRPRTDPVHPSPRSGSGSGRFG